MTTITAGAMALGLVVAPAAAAPDAPVAPDRPSAEAEAVAKAKIRPGLDRQLARQHDRGGSVDFWIEFDGRPDLSDAAAIDDWAERGAAVAEELRDTATRSQRGVQARLRASGVEFESFWATNAIKVHDADAALATALSTRSEVAALWPTFTVTPPEVTTAEAQTDAVDAIEWGIRSIRADQAWATHDARGQDIVVANLDTGVQFDHPALMNSYRGNNGDGTFTHDYNWFDSRDVCGDIPCDDHGHGTHTMGTMVGDDGQNHIGVAPEARWIATNGCCASDATLIASAQWLLEPTDTQGRNPQAAMRPHIINNSWGSNLPSNEPFLEDISAAWAASGIFAVWSNGNIGPQCATSGRPGSRAINYSVGAYDALQRIASFSSRGAGQDGQIKPDITAPGVNVRSSVPGGGFEAMNGTSMAAPHVAGAIALLWSARPAAFGDVEVTRALLDQTAIDTSDLSCGGTPENNNVYGEGRLDALALIDAMPPGPVGQVTGTITDGDTDEPLSGVDVTFTGPSERTTSTGSDGVFDVRLPVGTYEVTASRFGYHVGTATAEVTEDATVGRDLALTRVPSATVSGTVTDGSGHGWPLYARIRVQGTPVSTYSDPATGDYELILPAGETYGLAVDAVYPGYATGTDTVELADTSAVDKDQSLLVGSRCADAPGYAADCSPIAGGLLVGHVTDAATGEGIVGARVRSDDAPDDVTTTIASLSDPELGAGFYWMFSTLTGQRSFTASKGSGYTAATLAADIEAHTATTVDFALGAGHLEMTPGTVSGTVELGQSTTETIEVRNVGNAPATFEVTDRDTGFQISKADGDHVSAWDVDSAPGAPLQRIHGPVSPLRGGASASVGTAADAPVPAAASEAGPWLDLADHPVPVMDNTVGTYHGAFYSVGGTTDGLNPLDTAYAYDPATLSWSELAPMPQARMKPGGAFVDHRFYVIGGWGVPGSVVDSTAIYDPHTDSWAEGAQNPQPMAAAGVAVLDSTIYSVGGCRATCGSRLVMAYDVDADSYRRVADYPVPTAWLSCGAIDDRVVCAGGTSGGSASRATYMYDPAEDTWIQAADLPRQIWGAGYAAVDDQLLVSGGVADGALTNEGWKYDPADDAWTPLPNSTQTVYRGGSACGFVKIGGSSTGQFTPTAAAEQLPGLDGCDSDLAGASWLTTDSPSVTLDAGESTVIELTLDSSQVSQPGSYTAQVRLVEDTPFDVTPVDVTMRADPPRTWSKLFGAVAGQSCSGDVAPLDGATVSLAGSVSTWTFTVGADGSYARWLDRGENPVTVTAHKDAYIPDSRTVRLGRRPMEVGFVLDRFTC